MQDMQKSVLSMSALPHVVTWAESIVLGKLIGRIKEKFSSSPSVVFISNLFVYQIASNGFYVQTRILQLNNYSKSPTQISTSKDAITQALLRTGVRKSRMSQINSTKSANSAMNSGSNSLTHSGRGRPVL